MMLKERKEKKREEIRCFDSHSRRHNCRGVPCWFWLWTECVCMSMTGKGNKYFQCSNLRIFIGLLDLPVRALCIQPTLWPQNSWKSLSPLLSSYSFLGIQLSHVTLGRMEPDSTYHEGTALSTRWILWPPGDNFRARHNLHPTYFYSIDFYVHNSLKGTSKSIWRPQSAQSLNYYSDCFAY